MRRHGLSPRLTWCRGIGGKRPKAVELANRVGLSPAYSGDVLVVTVQPGPKALASTVGVFTVGVLRRNAGQRTR